MIQNTDDDDDDEEEEEENQEEEKEEQKQEPEETKEAEEVEAEEGKDGHRFSRRRMLIMQAGGDAREEGDRKRANEDAALEGKEKLPAN